MSDESLRATVLIANDQEWSARSLESIFAGEGYAVLRAFTGNQAIQKAEASRPDIIILDRQMPDLGGAEVCRRLRTDPRFGSTTPILITTAGQAGRTQRLEAFEAGAWDFISQPIEGEIILHKVRTFLEAKKAADAARATGFLDPATGLYNRTGFERRARELRAEALRAHLPVACVVFVADAPEIDHALEAADEVAASLAAFFRNSGRTADVVARLGPLKFAVLAPGTAGEGAVRLVERAGAALSGLASSRGPDGAPLTLRAGYCVLPDGVDETINAEELLARATASLVVPS